MIRALAFAALLVAGPAMSQDWAIVPDPTLTPAE
jgi:hypothetical protein